MIRACAIDNSGARAGRSGMDRDTEWLEPDGLGGFAMGTASGIRTRRYHALLLSARTPPTGRMVLISGFDAWLDGVPITTQHYAPDVDHPDGATRIMSFAAAPWPTWRFAGGLSQELFVERTSSATVLRWSGAGQLQVRLFLAFRDYHSLQHESAFDLTPGIQGGNVSWRPDPHGPAAAALTNGAYRHEPVWYRRFLYTVERDRGMDCEEDLASPGVFTFDLAAGPAVVVLRAGEELGVRAAAHAEVLAGAERARRAALPTPFARAADAYAVDRGSGRTIMAGFPWFTDWGRDTFIALRGLLLGTGRRAEAEAVLLGWAGLVDGGMLPNRFPDQDGPPQFNSIDAALWFCIAVHDVLQAGARPATATTLQRAVEAVIDGYGAGTRYGIGVDADGLVRGGAPGEQLTWMDVKCGDWVVTPRRGKPVEVQALWINALRIAAGWTDRYAALERRATASFLPLFADPVSGGLVDVIGSDGVADRSIRPNQVFAVGGLPFAVVDGAAAAGVLAVVERALLTPLGLRTLAPEDPAYQGRYAGGVLQRDGAYHQGTAWPWLLGAYVQAALRVRGDTAPTRAALRERCLRPLEAHLHVAGLGHVSEVADGELPHTPGGCPFQAWSMGEMIRIANWLSDQP